MRCVYPVTMACGREGRWRKRERGGREGGEGRREGGRNYRSTTTIKFVTTSENNKYPGAPQSTIVYPGAP